MTLGSGDWEEELLTSGLSRRARRVGFAYTGPGAGNDVPRDLEQPIAFTAGIPDPASLPIEELAAASDTVLRREGAVALEYGGAQGFIGLRSWLADHSAVVDGVPLGPENFSLTAGSAHALENVCATFVDEGDVVIVESPSFPGSIRVIRSMGCSVETVDVDANGLDVDALEGKLRELEAAGRRVKLLYTIPTFQNPTGTTLSLDRRHRLLDLCARDGILVVEDDAYGEISFDNDTLASLYSLARGKGVVKIGTFSKTIATGLRVGWIQAPPSIVAATLATRFDMGLSPFILRMIAEYAGEGRLYAHIEDVRRLYRRKRDLMIDELSERCGGLVSWTEPRGGFFLWLTLHNSVDPMALRAFAEEEKVLFAGGPGFFASPDFSPGEAYRFVRLAFSYMAENLMPEGVRRLARALERAAGD